MRKESILNFDVCTFDKRTLLRNIFKDYRNGEQLFLVNVNPEIIISNYKKEDFVKILNKQKYQIPDGTGIIWASKKQKGNIKERITGIDLMQNICEISCQYKAKIFLYGSTQENVEKAKKELQKTYKNIIIIGTCNGYEEEDFALSQIKESKPDIIFVGLGTPKQEEFIIKNMKDLKDIKIIMPVGGSFDVIGKSKKRAPKWMIRCNIEWLYRLFQEPKRITRQIKLVKYIYLILINKKGEKKNGKN